MAFHQCKKCPAAPLDGEHRENPNLTMGLAEEGEEQAFSDMTGGSGVVIASMFVLALIACVFVFMPDAMSKCREHSSFDTCFSTLNR